MSCGITSDSFWDYASCGHSAWQPSITTFTVQCIVMQPWGAPKLMGQDRDPDTLSIVEFKLWLFSEKVEIKSSTLKQSGAKWKGSNTRQASVFSAVVMCVVEHYLTIEARAPGDAIATIFFAFLFVSCTHCPHRCWPSHNINHPQPQRHLSFTASSLYIVDYGGSPLFGLMRKSLRKQDRAQNSAAWKTTKPLPLTSSLRIRPGLHPTQNPPVRFGGGRCSRHSMCVCLLLSLIFLQGSRVVFESKLKASLFTLAQLTWLLAQCLTRTVESLISFVSIGCLL